VLHAKWVGGRKCGQDKGDVQGRCTSTGAICETVGDGKCARLDAQVLVQFAKQGGREGCRAFHK
jgi:hypothetical protein